ncbi:MAG TPA: hypothetical protein VE907_07015 [Gammaproteobacteria bacterium]|nr:hypothetical protein [Gammaproteobacteria bacterium]
MTRIISAVALALALAAVGNAGAARTIEYVEGAYEVMLADLVLPASASGRLSVRTCATCARINVQVNANTEYSFGGGKPMSLADFQTAVTQLRQRPGAVVGGVVFYSLATKRATRVVLTPAS